LTPASAIFHTSGLKKCGQSHRLSKSNKPLKISCRSDDKSKGVNEKERLITRELWWLDSTSLSLSLSLSLHLVWISHRIKAQF